MRLPNNAYIIECQNANKFFKIYFNFYLIPNSAVRTCQKGCNRAKKKKKSQLNDR